MARFERHSKEGIELHKMFQTEPVAAALFLCGPVYRDMIVFYDKHDHVISTLNLCLECGFLATKQTGYLDVDFIVLDWLVDFLFENGHTVERKGRKYMQPGWLEKREEFIKNRDQSIQ
ncbi:hypothetical protein LX64_02360 [Chitinophaga skermanii]|uniref:Uncharacterized protein n=2 Tax=Chitinophaga skermanii TaxID=331697 RepID=A0A327QKM8_9BACT|nr:hypothetical protein LX64_02360 [Chitinophaga skermanii]